MKKAPHTRRKPVVEEIEPRILYSADFSPGLLAAAPSAFDVEQRTLEAGGEFAAQHAQSTPQQQVSRHEVVFVDTATPDYQKLIDDIKAQSGTERQLDVVLLDPNADGIKQISATLAGMQEVSAVHLIGHGTDGEIALGGATLNFDSLVKSAVQIKGWGQALTADADLLIYGCDVAEHADGKALIDALSRLTGADAAASDDITGAAAKGGDWMLEYSIGHIETALAVSAAEQASWDGTLQATAVGTETRVNTTTAGTQETNINVQPRTVAMATDGSYVVAWSGQGTGDTTGIFFQRFTAAGAAVPGGEVRVNTTTTNTQSDPAVAMDANGNFIVAWTSVGQDGSGEGVYARRYNAAGTALDLNEFRVNSTTSGDQRAPVIGMNASGAFVIAWGTSGQDGGGQGTYAQRYNASGAAQGSEFLVNFTTAGDQWCDSAAMDAAGNFIIAFSSSDGGGLGVYTRRFDASGTALTGDVLVNTVTGGDQTWDSVAMNASGQYVIAWNSAGQDGSGVGIYARRFDASGVAQGAAFLVNTTTAGDQLTPTVGIDGQGNFVITWSSDNQDSGTTWGVYKQDYNADGTTSGLETLVNTTIAGDQQYAGVAMNAFGQYVVVWSGNGTQVGQVDTSGVFTQRYTQGLVVDTASDSTTGSDTSSISALLANRGADGLISLREAILATNNTPNVGGADRIYFNIAGAGVHTISPTSALPDIIGAVIIDGSTQAGFTGTPLIELNGVLAGGATSGFTLAAGSSGSTINGLTINRFGYSGILITGSSNNIITGNFVGTDAAGTLASANGRGIVLMGTSANNTIGGTTAAQRNILSGNAVDGVQLQGVNVLSNIVQGNYIGLDVTGTVDLGNTNQGVAIFLGSSGNTIGGTAVGAGNVISGNNAEGVRIKDAGTTGNVVLGNLIGTNAAGTVAIGNGTAGVHIITGAASNTIGGATAAARNVISGNGGDGVAIDDFSGTTSANANTIQGNYIGVDRNGTVALGNGSQGILLNMGSQNNNILGNVIGANTDGGIRLIGKGSGSALNTTGNIVRGNWIGTDQSGVIDLGNLLEGIAFQSGASSNTIGGTTAGQGNVIAFNGSVGVALYDNTAATRTQGNSIRGNSIYSNTALGIDLSPATGGGFTTGVTANDTGDGDVGANNLQNAPVLSGTDIVGGNITIGGKINSAAGTAYAIDFFASTAADASGYGEGKRYLGSTTTAATDGSGNVVFSVTLVGAAVSAGEFITATATDPSGNTSEFSQAIGTDELIVDTTSDSTTGSVTTSIAALLANRGADGLISLREALLATNNSANGALPDRIYFNIPGGGVHTIDVTSALPTITGTVTIDATSQPGFAGTPLIELNGTSAGGGASGLILAAGSSGSTIKGFAINRFADNGIAIDVSSNNVISGNFLGTNAAGTVGAGFGNVLGVLIQGASVNNQIGGTTAAERNIISANTVDGLQIRGGASANVVEGNYIGVDVTGTLDRGNTNQGVAIFGSSINNTIGGTAAGAGNVISGNNASGLRIDDAGSTGNAILGNAIYANTNLGIDLNSNGLTLNDPDDVDGGANRSQNYPLLASAVTTGTQVTITGTLNSTAGRTFRIEFFASVTADPLLHGEAERYLGFVDVTTVSTSIAINTTLLSTVVAAGEAITATATDLTTNDTSEFALNVLATNSNTAPVLDASKTPVLNAINEDAGAPSGAVGTLVSSLVDFAAPAGQVDNVTDVDAAPQLGIAVTAANTVSGNWFYSINAGGTWNALGAVADNNARLLAADASTRIYFQPAADFNGALANAITFRAWDRTSGSNGTLVSTASNGGSTAFSSFTDTAAITVNAVNDAPQGASNTVTTLEDTAYTFAAVDFGFSDPSDTPANSLLAVKITTLPGAGSLANNGVAVSAGDFVTAADIALGRLQFTPGANGNGAAYTTFTFQVQDGGGTVSGGVDLDQSANTMTVAVTAVNDAPAGTNKTVAALEDTAYTFATADFGFTDPNDTPANSLLAVKITTLPGAGSLANNGVAVSAGDFVTAADIALGRLRFTPGANASGAGYATFTFQVQDGGGTASGGADLDLSANTITVDVTALNDAPAGTSNTVATLEDTAYTFAAVDFGFSDPSDTPANSLLAVRITTLPGAGSLANNGVAVSAGDFVTAADIALGRLRFTPGANGNGAAYTSFTFQVQDGGGTASGGVDLDQSANTMTVDVTAVNDAPAGTNKTVTALEDSVFTFATADFGFTDPNDTPANSLLAVKITTLPGAGSLANNGVAVSAGDFVTAADIALGRLQFTPGANASGASYATFTFQVQDGGGTASTGVDLDQSANTITVDVTAVNDAPAGTSNTVATLEDTAYTFAAVDFGFSDPGDTPANSLLAVKITTLPGAGSLANNGVAVSAGDFVTAADIALGRLRFTPGANASGAGYTSFTFQVQDGGGVTNGGLDTDATPRTMTVDVTAVNDAPQGTSNTVTTAENSTYTFGAVDFGFGDASDSPANSFTAVEITTLPGAGSLTNNGAAVTAGQFVALADVSAGLLVFTPAASGSGAGYASFTFQVQDSGGTANGGVDTDTTPRTMTINVTGVNDAPVLGGSNNFAAINEDPAVNNGTLVSALIAGQTSDVDAGAQSGIAVTAVDNTNGTWEYSLNGGGLWTAFAGTTPANAQLLASNPNTLVRFVPDANWNGTVAAGITFRAWDQTTGAAGGTADTSSNGGVTAFSTATASASITVNAVNDAPVSTNNTVTTLESTAYTFGSVDFGFSDLSDTPADTFIAVEITTLPGAGSLTNNAVAVTAGQFVTLADITAGNLVFTPVAGANGAGYASFTFQVQDDGGTANGGVDVDATPRTMTIDVTTVNDAPTGTSNTVSTLEDNAYTFGTVDFGFTDPNDAPGNSLLAVRITTLPGAGSLTDNGVAVIAGQFVALADISGGQLVFTPAADANGAGYAGFTFQVQDNGGTAGGGVDIDPTARTLTVDVTAVNDAPVLGNDTLTIMQGGTVVLSGANLSAADIDSAAGALLFTVSNVADGQFELVAAPGVAVTTFTQGAVAAGQVRFVHDGSSTAPGFDLMVSDGTLSAGPTAASIVFSVPAAAVAGPGPVVIVAPPPPPPAPVFTANPPAEPAAPAEPTTESSTAAAAGEPEVVFSPGRVLAAESVGVDLPAPLRHGLSRFVRLEPSSARAGANPAPSIQVAEMTLLIQGSEPTYMEFGPSTLPNWSAHSAFPDEGHGAERDQIKVIMESVEMGGLALSVGVVWWASRVGGLIGSLLASMPAWRHLDPLPIMSREEDEEEGDQLQDADADADELAVAMVLEGSQPQRAGL